MFSSKNGAGGGGGGCIIGLLKFDFNTFSEYKIQLGSGGTGGAGGNDEGKEGGPGGHSYLYGVRPDGYATLLAAAYGGNGGISNNNN